MQLELIQVICGLIRESMGLEQDQVVVYNQRWKIPADDRLYISVKFLSSRPYSIRRIYDAAVKGSLLQKQSVNEQVMFTINVMSIGDAARVRKNEILFALSGDLYERTAELYGFSIGRIPATFVDLSAEEGSAIISRYAITVPVLTASDASSKVPYFDTFPRKLIVQP